MNHGGINEWKLMKKYIKRTNNILATFDLDSYSYYSLEDLKRISQEKLDEYNTNPLYQLKRQEYNVTEIKFHVETEYNYYDDTRAVFKIIIFGDETDEFLEKRVSEGRKRSLAATLASKKKKENQDKLLNNPEYQQFLELKKKFN